MHPRFRKLAKPDDELVQALETALAAAKEGRLRTGLVIAINPLQQVETFTAGDLGPLYRNALLGALAQITHQLIDTFPK